MKKLLLIFIISLLFLSCLTPKSEPVPNKEIIEEIVPEQKEPQIEISPPNDGNFVATKEEYEETFEQVEDLIVRLNTIISSGDYNMWMKYLSDEYIATHEDKEYLDKLSDNIVLKDYGIKLKSLRDYFNYIVRPARSNVKIDELQFVDEDNLKVFTYKNNDKFLVYMLTKGESSWIISD